MKRVLNILFPARIANDFPGPKSTLYVFYALTALTLWRSWHHLTAPDGGAQSIATIPLDSYAPGAAGTIVGLFALWGLAQFLFALVMLLAALRYRAMIPLVYLLLVFEYAGRMVVGMTREIETTGTAPGAAINLPFALLALAMLALCCWPQTRERAA